MKLTKKPSYILELTEKEMQSLKSFAAEFPPLVSGHHKEKHPLYAFSVELYQALEKGEE